MIIFLGNPFPIIRAAWIVLSQRALPHVWDSALLAMRLHAEGYSEDRIGSFTQRLASSGWPPAVCYGSALDGSIFTII